MHINLCFDRNGGAMPSAVSPQELKHQISRIKASLLFAGTKHLQALLEFLAFQALSGGSSATQGEISKVLGFREFDPTKPTVRITAGRLRSRLIEFYATEGRDDTVIVEFPKGPPYVLNVRKKRSRGLSPLDKCFQLYSQGRILWAQRTPESLAKAVSCFQRAILIESQRAEPHAALALTYFFMAIAGADPRKLMRPAKTHAEKAVNLDPNSAEAHAALAAILSTFEWNWKRAGAEFNKAVNLDPDSFPVYSLRANYLLSLGRTEDAAKDARRLLQMMASSPSSLSGGHAAKVLYAAGRYDESEELLIQMKQLAPHFYMIHWQLGLLYGTKGDLLLAKKAIDRASALAPENPAVVSASGWINALAGNVDAATTVIERLKAIRNHQYIPGTDLAVIYTALGRFDEAFDWLNKACRERSIFLTWLGVWPPLRPLLCDLRSRKILKKMGLDALLHTSEEALFVPEIESLPRLHTRQS
jgi:tetratricopeptide (TPR) repeat protein